MTTFDPEVYQKNFEEEFGMSAEGMEGVFQEIQDAFPEDGIIPDMVRGWLYCLQYQQRKSCDFCGIIPVEAKIWRFE